jgi:ZIP family zinc transporter
MELLKGIEEFLASADPVMAAFLATTFTWLVTAAGASLVFFFGNASRKWLDGMLGFTGGVMVAASFWSLLAPSIAMSERLGSVPWLAPAIGFAAGALFLFSLDKVLPHLHINFDPSRKEGMTTDWHRSTLLVLAITLHNIPEGLAVGVLFGGVAAGMPEASIGGAMAARA